jgi:hypothetical protein
MMQGSLSKFLPSDAMLSYIRLIPCRGPECVAIFTEVLFSLVNLAFASSTLSC